jgi:hypothetical protein
LRKQNYIINPYFLITTFFMLSLKNVRVQIPQFVQNQVYRLFCVALALSAWQTSFAQTCVPGVTATPTSASCTALNSAASGGSTGKITLAGFPTNARYQYSTGATFASGSAVPASITAIPAGGIVASALPDPAVSQAYTVRVYDATNAACYTDLVVTLYHINCGTICPGESYTLQAQAGLTSYQWFRDTGSGPVAISGANAASYTANAVGIYTYTGLNTIGCLVNLCQPVSLVPGCCTPINASITGNLAACNSGTTTITTTVVGGTAPTYLWSTGATTAAITQPAGTYTVTITDGVCQTTRSATITNTNITAGISGNNVTCQGGTTLLTAIGGTAFVWSAGATPNNTATVSVSAGTYTVTTSLANGCTATATAAVSNTTIVPAITIAGAADGCVAANTVLTASGGTSYLWSANAAGAITAAITVTPVATTTIYTVTVTGLNNCSATATASIRPIATPSAVSAAAAICVGDGTNLTASGADTYVWSTTPVETTNVINVQPAVTTLYTVTATTALGCTATATVTVIVNNPLLSTSLASTNPTTCGGSQGTITVTATGSSGTLRYRNNGGAWQSSNIFNGLAAGNYIIEVSYTNGTCTYAFGQITLSNPTPPVITFAGNNFTCQGGNTTLTGNGAASYAWSNSQTTPSVTVAAGTYTVTGTASNGCTATASITVTNTTVTPTITGSNNVCVGTTASFTAAGGTSYAWSNGQNTAIMNTTTSGTYTVTVTITGSGANVCTASTTTTLIMTPLPSGITASSTPSTCWSGVANNDGTITLAGFTTGQRYQYSLGSTFAAGGAVPSTITAIPAGGVIATAIPNPATATQIYTIRLYSQSNSDCYTDIQVTITRAECACPTQNCGTIIFYKN